MFGQCADSFSTTTTHSTGEIDMSHLLEKLLKDRSFRHADILSRFGETVCLVVDREILTLARVEPLPSPTRGCEEDPERWDGLE